MQRTCPICGETKNEDKFRRCIGGGRRNVCRGCQEEVSYIRKKSETFEAYGNKCACCGEDNPLFLQLDHVKNDSYKHRHLITTQLYTLVKKMGFPKDFQLLCANCNWSKGFWGICPHQSGRTTEVVRAQWKAVLARAGKRYRNFQEKLVDPEFREARPFKSEEMVGNKRFPKQRGAHGYFTKKEVAEGLKKIESESK